MINNIGAIVYVEKRDANTIRGIIQQHKTRNGWTGLIVGDITKSSMLFRRIHLKLPITTKMLSVVGSGNYGAEYERRIGFNRRNLFEAIKGD